MVKFTEYLILRVAIEHLGTDLEVRKAEALKDAISQSLVRALTRCGEPVFSYQQEHGQHVVSAVFKEQP